MTQGVQLMKFKSENSMSEKKSMMHSGSGKTESGMTLEQLTCVRAAVAKRESSLLSALTTSSSTLATAYSTRAFALDAAYQLTDKVARRTAIESAWEAWMTSLKDARKAHQVSQKAAWDTFKSDTKTCGVSSKQTDAG